MDLFCIEIIDDIPTCLYNKLFEKVSYNTQNRILNFKKISDKKRTLLGELLVRFVIGQKLKMENKSIALNYSVYGKPSLNGVNNFHFNLSHSGKWVGCVCDSLPIGLDIEKVREIEVEQLFNFFSDWEIQYLNSVSSMDKISKFYEFWTLKESFVKNLGLGLSLPLNSFTISPYKEHYYMYTTYYNGQSFYLNSYQLDMNYKISVCAEHTNFTDEIEIINFNDLSRWFLNGGIV
ncbi:4'-phosphopantetheinyl transferase family protein [Lysinibacillus xylanilyticus]|uniref:4'-phosphopantetheinyl transferase family protein n=1 Tax=Lysinibacillus xylanilyticus TaxID=582475 RepID=UPI003815B6EA